MFNYAPLYIPEVFYWSANTNVVKEATALFETAKEKLAVGMQLDLLYMTACVTETGEFFKWSSTLF